MIVDGTNLDDLKDYIPGIMALRKNGIRSPYVEIGIKKSDIRSIAQECGLSVYDKPSNTCLASRIPRVLVLLMISSAESRNLKLSLNILPQVLPTCSLGKGYVKVTGIMTYYENNDVKEIEAAMLICEEHLG